MKLNKKTLVMISIIMAILLVIIIAIIINKKNIKTEKPIDVEKLEEQFAELYNNNENEYVATLYSIQKSKTGKYKIEANIPYVAETIDTTGKANKEINEIFVKKLLDIYNNSEKYSLLTIDYTSSINNNILSIAIKCLLKEGNNAQRTIIKTYNFDIENQKEIKIVDIVSSNKQQEIQEQINQKIITEIKREQVIEEQGYNVYKRNPNDSIYLLENASEFYINNNILYIIYSYGNKNYTSTVDLIITQI